MKSFYEMIEILEAKNVPTNLNLFTMYSVLRDNNGIVPARVPSVNLNGLKRCLAGGLLEAGPEGFVPTPKGMEAMVGFYQSLLKTHPDTPKPTWLSM